MSEMTPPDAAASPHLPASPDLASAPVAVIDDFLPDELAHAMRADIDAHFANPERHQADTHQVWNYWFVPELYAYLRTEPEKIIDKPRVAAFLTALRHWSLENLGMGNVTRAVLSLYVSGCRQGWHNDASNGRFAFVYSLTRDQRATTGGETLVMREGDALRDNLTRPVAGRNLYEKVAPRFNRLVIFDDRIPHAVERVEGVMDPVQGRFVLHGHISEAGMLVNGALSAPVVNQRIAAARRDFAEAAGDRLAGYQGPLSLRLKIAPTGAVDECDVAIDRVLHPNGARETWEELREDLCERLEALTFPPAAGATTVILPVIFGQKPRPEKP